MGLEDSATGEPDSESIEAEEQASLPPPPLSREEFAGDWREQAQCRNVRNIDFFPDPSDGEAVRKATAVCASCAVINQCLEFALETNQQWGVWGGTGEKERRRFRKRWLADQRRNA